MKVRRLPSDLANQIAAGEVVERPASVVKELVENALDAGATRVRVEIKTGGTELISVSDDGEGMSRDDAALALERHATSKITGADDLFRLTTFGFRGEALPSIASVSRMTLVTRTKSDGEATSVRIEGGGAVEVAPAGAATGTTVTVADLFFNVPARRKFLKSTATEAAHVSEVLLLSALARPGVSFSLVRDGRLSREHLRVESRRARATSAFEGERLAAVSGARGPLSIEAYLAGPERARAGAGGLHLFVNDRPVKDRALARAVAQSYGSVLEGGRYPIGALYIDMPPELVDVNVHPQKAEVRFQDGRAVFEAVVRELGAELARAFALPSGGHPYPRASQRPGWPRESGAGAPLGFDASRAGHDARVLSGRNASPAEDDVRASSPEPNASAGSFTLPFGGAPAASPGLWDDSQGFYSSLRFIGQAHGTFLVCEGDDGLYLLDQHAAAERVTFHHLRKAASERRVGMQRLLIPEIVALSADEVSAIDAREEEIRTLGLEVRPVSASSVAIHAVPELLVRASPERLLRDLLAELGRDAARPFGNAVDLVLATMACHGSIRAGDAVGAEEANQLLRALDDVDFSGHCPHGRPVVTRLALSELMRRVGR